MKVLNSFFSELDHLFNLDKNDASGFSGKCQELYDDIKI